MLKVITREEALHLGLNKYFTGKPCKKGHIEERYVLDYQCTLCKKNNAVARIQREDVKVRLKKQKREDYLKHKDKRLSTCKTYKKNNQDVIFLRRTLSRLENPYHLSNTDYEKILGYTRQEFINHIESLWEDGMSWDNRSEWHIDHIKSIKHFKEEGISDPKIVNALSNLQPLWAGDNLKKGY